MDKLEEIFRMQDALNQRIGVHLPPPTDEEKAKWILNYTRAMQQETAEATTDLRFTVAVDHRVHLAAVMRAVKRVAPVLRVQRARAAG